MIIQIYEIQTPSDAEAMIGLGVDHIGSVILSQEDWKVPKIKEVMELVAGSRSKSSLIPLYNDPDSVFRTLDYYRPDIVHFCEALEWEGDDGLDSLISLQQEVRRRFPKILIMRSIPIAEPGMAERVPTLAFAKKFSSESDLFLTDTLILTGGSSDGEEQPVGGFVGITGKTCDWDMAARLVRESGIPVILAGGISPENASAAIGLVNPSGIDSCTLTNAIDQAGKPVRFKKDFDKVRRLVQSVRNVAS